MQTKSRSVPTADELQAIPSEPRLNALCEFDLLDSPRDDGFQRIVRLIKMVLNVDAALVSVIDGHRQWYKACRGLASDEIPLEKAFCFHVLTNGSPIIVPDTHLDERFKYQANDVAGLAIRFYASVPLRTKSGLVIGTVCAIGHQPRQFTQHEQDILEELTAAAMDLIELQQTASEDSLTEALTRRAFRIAAEQERASCVSAGQPLGVVTLDIDHFKQVNDTYGHTVGDEVLKEIAKICRQHLREKDLLCRMGGEEFAILLPNTSETGTYAFAEALRSAIANRAINCSFGPIAITVSLGCAALNGKMQNLESLLTEADTALYDAKRAGRNQTKVMDHSDHAHQIGDRKRQFSAGTISFDDGRQKIACTVKSIGPDGAGLIVSDAMALPENFTLSVHATQYSRECSIIARHKRNIEVAFCG